MCSQGALSNVSDPRPLNFRQPSKPKVDRDNRIEQHRNEGEVKDVELLRSDFIADLCLGRNRPFDQTVKPMDRAARTLLSPDVVIMGRPCDLCPSVNLGFMQL